MSKPVFEDLFTFSGRRNRKSYLLYALALFCFWLVVALVLIAPAANNSGSGGSGGVALAIIALILIIPTAISSWAVGGQRCRDFGWTAWAVLLTAIPYLGFLFAIAFMVIPGNVGENRYGPDPLAKA